MIAAVMQPYFFPYIGYFQLMRAVDLFVFYDDVQYMKGGWINRNRILVKGAPAWITLPVERDHLALDINQRSYIRGEWDEKIKGQLRSNYAKAPYFSSTYAFVCELLNDPEVNVARLNASLLMKIAGRLGLRSKFVISSDIQKSAQTKGEARVIDLCGRMGASTYVNAIGGLDLYDWRVWKEHGVDLCFLQPNDIQYDQFGLPIVRSLSIIDVLMFNDIDRIETMLGNYSLISPRPRSEPLQ